MLSPKSVAVNAEDKWVHFSDTSPERVTPELTPREKVVSPPAASDNPADSPPPGPPGPPGPSRPAGPPRNVPSPLNLEEVQKKVAEQSVIKDAYLEAVSSPKDSGLGQRAAPPPPPPPSYRTAVPAPGPGSGGGAGTAGGTSHCPSERARVVCREWPWLPRTPPPSRLAVASALQPPLLRCGCPVPCGMSYPSGARGPSAGLWIRPALRS